MAVEPSCIEEAAKWLHQAFQREAATDAITYRIELTGSGGGSLLVRVDANGLETDILDGDSASLESILPDVTVSMRAADFFGVLSGRENPDLLFLGERLQIKGELSLALRMRSLFQAPS